MFSPQKLQSNVQNGKWLTMINSLRISKPDVPSRSISINYCKPGLALQTMIQIKLMITSQTYELSKCQHNLSYFNKPVQPWTLDPSQPATPLRMLFVFKWKVDIMCVWVCMRTSHLCLYCLWLHKGGSQHGGVYSVIFISLSVTRQDEMNAWNEKKKIFKSIFNSPASTLVLNWSTSSLKALWFAVSGTLFSYLYIAKRTVWKDKSMS